MGTKAEEVEKLENGEGCLGKADDDEPIFILRAQDALSPDVVRTWAVRAQTHGCPQEKVDEAYRLAARMEEWQQQTGRAKFPD